MLQQAITDTIEINKRKKYQQTGICEENIKVNVRTEHKQ